MHRRLQAISKINFEERIKTLMEKNGTMPLEQAFQELQNDIVKEHSISSKHMKFWDYSYKHGIVSVPAEWIYVEIDNPEEADFACAISVSDGKETNNIPLFITFLRNHPDGLTDHQYREIEEKCAEVFPHFKRIIDEEIYYSETNKYLDNHGHTRNKREFFTAPKVGIFLIDNKVNGTGLPYGCRIKYKDNSSIEYLKNCEYCR